MSDVSRAVEAQLNNLLKRPATDRDAAKPSFFGCINCGKAMSIGEVIERHCESCDMHMKPFEVRIAQ
ncbi:hypothetical protein [Rhizobium johnstonii]|uniref:hypothetical protein n=1 Tax=Rhizobium johnstonii TaxID=3019933 RepID=UPI003F99FBA8